MKNKQLAEYLLNSTMPFAEKMLQTNGEFYPFGGFVAPDYSIIDVGAEIPAEARPKSQELINLLLEDFKNKAATGSIIACTIIFDVRITDPRTSQPMDAIQACIDCIDNYSIEIIKPYSRSNGEIIFQSIFAQEGKLLTVFKS